MKKAIWSLVTHSEDSDTQADMSLYLVHTHFILFCHHIMAH